ncbi:MAG: exodeoxyribonuclease VII small subunit [Chlamydiae bacterium]|nr:exodeoxyribonuclease VII small subunit [Chlamydiota bacterium]
MEIEENLSFEAAHEKLEKILTAMNSGKLSLEESLSLFEKAEKLMRRLEKELKTAEQKIEAILKGSNGELALDSQKKPRLAPFTEQEF